MWTNVNGSNGPPCTRSKTMRAVQHVAAQELAVDVDELRVRADRAGAGHAVRLQREPLGRAHLKTYSGTGSRAQPRKGPSIRGDNARGAGRCSASKSFLGLCRAS